MEKSEAEERWELPEGDVLLSAPLLDFHETEDAEHGPGHCGEPQWTAAGLVKIPQRNERPAWLSNFQVCYVLSKKLRPDLETKGVCF